MTFWPIRRSLNIKCLYVACPVWCVPTVLSLWSLSSRDEKSNFEAFRAGNLRGETHLTCFSFLQVRQATRLFQGVPSGWMLGGPMREKNHCLGGFLAGRWRHTNIWYIYIYIHITRPTLMLCGGMETTLIWAKVYFIFHMLIIYLPNYFNSCACSLSVCVRTDPYHTSNDGNHHQSIFCLCTICFFFSFYQISLYYLMH